jgi:hypothetical protein
MQFRLAHCSFYISQQPNLYDVAPLIQYMPTELVLHNLVSEFYLFDHAEVTNTSLTCICEIYTQLDKATDTLAGYQPFFLQANATILSPNAQANSYWAQSLSQPDA